MTVAERFGRNVFMARRRAGLSQAGLAQGAGLCLDTVFKIEHGKRSPRLDTLLVLADTLGIDPCELLKGLRP
jgi:transcriptional regulator with XRE-family HTH domain